MIDIESIKKVLITRTDRIGDVILTLPLVNIAKNVFRNAKVFFLVKEYTRDLLRNYEGVDELFIEETYPGFIDKYKFFKSQNFDLVICVKPGFELALIFYLCRIKYRIGTGYRWYSFLFNCRVYEHRKVSDKHESEYNINLLRYFLKDIRTENKFNFKFSEQEKIALNEKLKKLNANLSGKYIIIHPGSKGSARDLPGEKFSYFIKTFLVKHKEFKILLTGLLNEKDFIQKIISTEIAVDQGRLVNLAGELSLRELMILISNTKLFISNSTGPIHIAGALNKNIIGFYPNSKVMSDTRWKPLAENVVILKPDKNSDDMSTINVEDIIRTADTFL